MQVSTKMWKMLPALLVAGMLLVVGCDNGTSGAVEGEDEEATYEVGEPIEDSTLAVIVTSEYGADTLTASEFRQQFGRIQQQAPQLGLGPDHENEMRRILVESFVGQHVLMGEAQQRGLEPDTAMIEAQLEQARGQFGGDEQFQQMLEAQGLTEEEVRTMMRDQMRQQMMQEELAAEAEEPTEEEVTAYQEEQSQQIRARHILFLSSEGDEETIRQEAQAVLDSIKAGADFAEMARRHSDDGSAEEGGDLGYFRRGQMVEPFEEAAFALADSGDVTDELVQTQYGYHIIQKLGEQQSEGPATEEARQMILRNRQGEAVRAGLDRLRAQATVRINPDIVEGVDLTQQASDIMP